jgi:hypothetical protein
MKMFFTQAVLFFSFFAVQTKAQNTFPTSGDAGIGTTTPDAKLKIMAPYTQAIGFGAFSGVPGLRIERTELQPGGTPPNTPPNIIEVYSRSAFTVPANLAQPAFIINHARNIGLGTNPLGLHRLSVNGTSFLDGNTQVRTKFRINSSSSLTSNDWTTANFPYSFSVDAGASRFLGNVEIGSSTISSNLLLNGDLVISGNNTATAGTNEIRLSSNGNIRAREVRVDISQIPDYVFKEQYKLMSLADLANYIKTNGHLPNIKSEQQYTTETSIDLGELNLKLLEKVEELTLYVLQQQKEIDLLKKTLVNNK